MDCQASWWRTCCFRPWHPSPASLSRRWIQNALREELRFEGAIFTDDLSMGGAKEFGDVVARASAALQAGCDVLPVCNDRPAVEKLLDELDFEIQPSSHLRLVRMRGRAAPEREALLAGEPWRASQELLARSSAPPALDLTAGNA
jgi:beta-N-acetylhexosaminidase